MAKIKVPEQYEEGFKAFAGLSKAKRDSLLDFLDKAGYGKLPLSLVQETSQLLDVEERVARLILVSIYSLYGLRDASYSDMNDTLSGVVQALKEIEGTQDLDFDSLKPEFERILSSNSNYYLSFKASDLNSERERLLNSIRIISDYRPIFSDDKDFTMQGAVVTHNLKIVYHENGQTREIYFALDDEDIKRLKLAVERAERKAKVMRDTFGTAGLKIFELGEE